MTARLGLDTSGRIGSAAVWAPAGKAGRAGMREEVRFEAGMIHGIALAPAVDGLLGGARISARDLSLIAVGLGPGSYTGVRVGVSFAKALAHATGVPIVGVPSFDAVAAAAPADRPLVCAGDARRGTLYVAVYLPAGGRLVRDGPIRLATFEETAALLPPGALVVGDALEQFADHLSGEGRTLGDQRLWRASAVQVAVLGDEMLRRDGPSGPHELAPIYLRPTEAEERRAKKEGAG